MHLYIELNTGLTENVSSSVVKKLYELASGGTLDATSDLKGTLHTTIMGAREKAFLEGMFSDLHITADEYSLSFEDPNVETAIKNILENKGYGSDLTISNLAKITQLGGSSGLANNSSFLTLNDLLYLTGCVTIDWHVIDGNVNVTSLILPPNLITIRNINGCSKLKAFRIPNKVTGDFSCYACEQLELVVIDGSISNLTFGENGWVFSCPNDVVIRGSVESIVLYNRGTKNPTTTANIWVPDVDEYKAKNGFALYIDRLKPLSEMSSTLLERVNNLL